MAVEAITFVYKLEVPRVTTAKENATAHLFPFLPFVEEKAATRQTAIMMEKPGPEDNDTLTEKNDVEKSKITGDSLLKQAPDEMAIDTTLEKVSIRDAEMAACKNSKEMQVDSIPREDSQEKAEATTEQDFELAVTDAMRKVDINSEA